jgi:superfamily II DNA or RNA helicase
MDTIKLYIQDEVYFKVKCDAGIGFELSDHFAYLVPNAKFHPMCKSGRWDGKIKMYNLSKSIIPRGILPELEDFCKTYDYKLEHAYDQGTTKTQISDKELHDFIDEINPHSGGVKLTIRDYQFDAIKKSIENMRATCESPTGSGKSLIIYILIRWMERLGKKVLLICPTTGLVEQMYKDFSDYSSENGWVVPDNVHRIYSGKEKISTHSTVISTWQSLNSKLIPPDFFDPFQCVFVDECHLAKGSVLQKILSQCKNAEYRNGFTGSLSDVEVDRITIKGMLGPIIRVASTRALIDKGQLSDIRIKVLMLNYSKEVKKATSKFSYPEEIDFLVSNEKRNRFIRNLAGAMVGNTLVLTTLVEKHGQVIYDMLKEKYPDRPIYFIHGGVDVDDREDIRALMEQGSDVIVVGSSATVATGTNIKNIRNVIAAAPSKSLVRVLQSIGRGLRKMEGKTHFTWYDIADKINPSKSNMNFAYAHAIERLKIYVDQEFDYNITEVDFE